MTSNYGTLTQEVLQSYPFPIAHEFDQLLNLLKDLKPIDNTVSGLETCCQQLRTVMWFASRYLAIAVLSCYFHQEHDSVLMEQDSELDKEDSNLESNLRTEIERLITVALAASKSPKGSFDHDNEIRQWLEIVYKIIDFWSTFSYIPFISPLKDWSGVEIRTQSRELASIYDRYASVYLRKNADLLLDYFDKAFEVNLNFLSSMGFVREYQLVHFFSCEMTELTPGKELTYRWDGFRLMGERRDYSRLSLNETVQISPDCLNELSLMTRASDGKVKFLPLAPLAIFTESPSLPMGEVSAQSIAVIDEQVTNGKEYLLYRATHDRATRDRVEPVELRKYVDQLHKLRKKSLESKFTPLPPNATWSQIRNVVNQRTLQMHLVKIGGGEKYNHQRYLDRADIDTQMHNFLASKVSGFLIVGDAGVGKTNILCAWAELLANTDETIVLLRDCREFHSTTPSNIGDILQDYLTGTLGVKSTPGQKPNLHDLFKILDGKKPNILSARVVLLLDALNESADADWLLRAISTCLLDPNLVPNWFKVIVTCRTEPWDRFLRYELKDEWKSRFFGLSGAADPIRMSQFTSEEARLAYEVKYKLSPRFETLALPVQLLLHDPLMLGLTYRVYKDSEVPPDLHQNQLLRSYIDLLAPIEIDNNQERKFLEILLQTMYKKQVTEIPIDAARSTKNLLEMMPQKGERETPDNAYVKLRADILRETADTRAITFRVERVFEFALSEYILKPEAVSKNWSVEWFAETVQRSKEYPSLWGAVRSLLVTYLTDVDNEDRLHVVKRLSGYNLYEMGKILADVLVIIAGQKSLYVEVHKLLFEMVQSPRLDDRESSARSGQVAIAVARRLGLTDVLEGGVKSQLAPVRVASVQAIYYIWRRNRQAGLEVMKRVAPLMEIVLTPKRTVLLIGRYVKSKVPLNRPSRSETTLVPLTNSMLGLSMRMVAHCLREPWTSSDLNQIWGPIFDSIPKSLHRPIEFLVRTGGVQYISDFLEMGTVTNNSTIKAFTDLPLGHDIRQKAEKYLQECIPSKGPLTSILDEVVALTRIQDHIIHYVVQILFLTRGHQSTNDVLEICKRLCGSGNPYDIYEGTTKMGVFLYSTDADLNLLHDHVSLMEDQILSLWRGAIKKFTLAKREYVVDQLRYPIMYECSTIGANRTGGEVEFVRKVQQQQWDECMEQNRVDRDIALVSALGEAAVFGHIVHNTHVNPILQTLHRLAKEDYKTQPDACGKYYKQKIYQAIARSFSRIQAIYPDETERYLSLAPAQLRELAEKEKEESAGSVTFVGGQASLPWLFTRPVFRDALIHALLITAQEVTDLHTAIRVFVDKVFNFRVLRGTLEN